MNYNEALAEAKEIIPYNSEDAEFLAQEYYRDFLYGRFGLTYKIFDPAYNLTAEIVRPDDNNFEQLLKRNLDYVFQIYMAGFYASRIGVSPIVNQIAYKKYLEENNKTATREDSNRK